MLKWILFLCFLVQIDCRIGCKGLTGSKVDWFIVYKLPAGEKNANQGKAFLYVDSKNPQWALSKKDIEDDSVAVGATVKQIYKREPTAFHLMYSDDGPNTKADSYRGHSKGVLLFDSSTGFWLVHSAPNFPPTASYAYPASGVKFAQTFMCVSINTNDLGNIGDQLRFIQATPFDQNLPAKFATRFPVLRNVVAKQSLPQSATVFTSVKHMKTVDGVVIHSFAKHKKFQKDLWHDLVAPEMGTNLAVQSWLNGGAADLHSVCTSQYSVYDMKTVTVPDLTFNSSKDHSKWAVSDTERVPLVCVGDINRQKSQLSRGGGTLCIQSVPLWKTYRSTVSVVEPCKTNGIDHWIYFLVILVTSFFILGI
ncbi:unnamed protein product [Auanema sp. JU1783]|nr:unnamed protein product [Auanema sp. JU1783]